MDWDDIRYFLAVAREGSTNQAGKVLQVNHTTVARRISAFEEKLGTRLFDRTSEGYAMTQAAEDMYDVAAKMEECAHSISREMFGWDGALSGALTITAPDHLANIVVVPRLGDFAKRFPQIDLELIPTSDVVDLNTREADIALRICGKPPDHLLGKKAVSLELGTYASAKYLKRLKSSGERPQVILYGVGPKMPPWVRENFPDAKILLRTNTLNTTYGAVCADLGIAVMPCFHADGNSKLRRLNIAPAPINRGVWVLSHVDLRTTARVRAGREFLMEIVQDQRALILGDNSRYA